MSQIFMSEIIIKNEAPKRSEAVCLVYILITPQPPGLGSIVKIKLKYKSDPE